MNMRFVQNRLSGARARDNFVAAHGVRWIAVCAKGEWS